MLVEPDYFGGSSHHFSTVRELIDLPMLYKDFVFSTIQVEEARSLGADAVLLISALLSRQSLDHLIGRCMDLGMDPLVEIHDVQDLRKLKGCGHYESVDMLGVNSRDLQTMEIELKKLQKMRAELPGDKLLVGESGVSSPSDLRYLRGYDAVLIGTMFMSSDRPKESVSAVVQAAKEVVR